MFVLKAVFAALLVFASIGLLFLELYALYIPYVPPMESIKFPLLGSPNETVCHHTSSRARLEPPDGKMFFGFSLQWDRDVPSKLTQRLKIAPAIINTFVHMNETDFEREIIVWQADLVQKMGGMLEITLMLNTTPEKISEDHYRDFAALMKEVNEKYGVAVLLRFMHEMNGPWMKYGLKPIEQQNAWKLMAREIRAVTNMTALVWSPNIGGGYPFYFAGYDQNIPTRTSDPVNFAILDTNHDGVLNQLDDPYGPYYPGDDIVDWVGISLYSFSRYGGQHVPAPEGLLTDPNGIVSLYGGAFPYYPNWVAKTGKPFMFSETGAAIVHDGPVKYIKIQPNMFLEIHVKQRWWSEIFKETIYAQPNTRLSNTKAAIWFEEMKLERSYDDAQIWLWRDYRLTYNKTVRNTFKKDLAAAGEKILTAGSFRFSCRGEFIPVILQ